MGESRVVTRRLAIEIIIALVWFEILTSVSALVTGGWLGAALGIAVGVGLLLILANKRLLDSIEGTRLRKVTMPILVAVFLAFALFEFGNLRFQNLVLLGELQIPDLLRIVRATGSLMLAVVVIWELLRLPKRSS